MKQIRDAIVIGAGIVGSATALALIRAGVKRVTLIEKGPLASGMTRRSAGLVHPFQPHPLLSEFARSSLRFYSQSLTPPGGKPLLVRTGVALVNRHEAVSSPPRFPQIKADERELAPDAFRALYPALSMQSTPVLYSPAAGYADAVLTAQAMINAGKDLGLEIQTGTQVKQILVENHHANGVKTTTGELEAPNVIVTAGAWTEKLLLPLGIITRMHFRRGIIVFYEQPPNITEDLPILLDTGGEYFFRPHPYHMSAAGLVFPPAQLQGADSLNEFIAPADSGKVKQFVDTQIPSFASMPLKRAHSIVYSAHADGLPVLGPVPGMGGLYAAAGFETGAFAVAPAVGEMLAELIVDGSTGHDISSLAPSR